MISSLEIIFIIAAIFFMNLELCLCVCGRAEYKINGECCPMCAPGNCVYRHCTEDTSTTCVPCLESTYTAVPNGLEKCLICSVCDPEYGLKIKMKCTQSSDTVCEPLEGYYCMDQVRDSCTQAMKHTRCSPGQYIKQKGTALKDTTCDTCTAGTYSNGTFQTCQPHSKCEVWGLSEIKPGNNSSDVECGRQTPVPVIAGIIVPVAMVVVVVTTVALVISFKKKYTPVPPVGLSFIGRIAADEIKT
ncbi:tumor necrosis factor receptor superfamily member 14-like isoform X2 [Electrophorus electricus]|uniref:tumor necrosis factor receptor superfamily member 14-like isoform X2 n=1 Tax=Electrophorus electricus TaxID=8005 RepID=UPI0015D0391F|nr:tumor necrosis factor receptor superfamily member 14-like isoform X2 [Electrophorus electricus]